MATIETQYTDRDNIIDLLLKADGTAEDLSSITKMDLVIGSVTITNSDADAFPIKWDTGTTGKIQLQLGSETNLPAAGLYETSLVVYDATYPNGLVWSTFTLRIV